MKPCAKNDNVYRIWAIIKLKIDVAPAYARAIILFYYWHKLRVGYSWKRRRVYGVIMKVADRSGDSDWKRKNEKKESVITRCLRCSNGGCNSRRVGENTNPPWTAQLWTPRQFISWSRLDDMSNTSEFWAYVSSPAGPVAILQSRSHLSGDARGHQFFSTLNVCSYVRL